MAIFSFFHIIMGVVIPGSKGHGDHLKILLTVPSLLSSNVLVAVKPSCSLHAELLDQH